MHTFLFGVYPYIALTTMVVASIARYERDPFSWKSKSSQLLAKKQFVLGSILFHIGILLIFAGHFIGLLTPMKVFEVLGVSHQQKQMLAIVLGGVAGVMTLVGGLILLHRRLFNSRVRATSTFADTGILVLLVVQVTIGLLTIFVSLDHADGGEMVKLMMWAQSIIYFQADAAAYLIGTNWLFKVHILLGLTLFLLLPFTRLVHIFSAPIRFLWRPGYQIVRSKRGA